MASIISAGTTSGTSLNLSGDTSGVLQLASNGSTTAVTIDTNQRAAFVAGTVSLPAITTTGDLDTGIYFSAANTVDIATNGTAAAQLDSSQNLKFNSGYGSVATAYGCRAWVNFNGTSTVAIRASGNVTSITDNGTGDYTVNFTTAMPDANYAIQVASGRNPDGSGGEQISIDYVDRYATGSCRVVNTQPNSTRFDQPSMFVAIFR